MFKVKNQPTIGEDGYQYFTYGAGAAWKVGGVEYRIIEPQWNADGEYQSFFLEVIGQSGERFREMTLDRLNYLLESSKDVELINEGELIEMPLTKAEVEQYYQRFVKERSKRKREANAKLKESKEYQKLLKEEKELTPQWIRALERDAAEEPKLKKRMEKLMQERESLMDDLNIDVSALKAVDSCPDCGDKGITAKERICRCARAQSGDIKAYCAAVRIVSRSIEGRNEKGN